MSELLDALSPLEPGELLVATATCEALITYRNEAWGAVFGSEDPPWNRLLRDDQDLASGFIREAAIGSLVTNQLFLIHLPTRDEPLPVLLSFLPVYMRAPDAADSDADEGEPANDAATRIGAVTITGEVLAEPSTWTAHQTQRHRMETLGRMTMGIAHDFNNLLSAILGHGELLKTAIDEASPADTLNAHVRTMEQAALDGAALVRKIQQYIRQETQTSFEPLDLPTLIRDVVALTRPYWYNEPRRQGIAIHCDLELDAVPPIMGAAAELRDVFVNLILNAVQAMPRGGVLDIRTRHEPGRGVRVRLSDTGIGMSEEVQSRIFEPLFTTKGKRGTGMGLAVCYGIVQEHDGIIEVKSQSGAGAAFVLTFPPAETALPEEIPIQPAAPERTCRILVVDDERMVRTVLTKLLMLKGHEVREAASGAEALSMTEQETFDLIFTDQGMPEMSGRQLARALRRRFPRLPILLLTGDTEAGEPDGDVTEVLSKPFKLKELQAAIQSYLP